mmetsp:Transcript_20859/g.45712  ORF Transcript_20859/g.45712 Transcript_20859/m.45712 type:complete len:260 (-) Transcript_20859:78-857(-)
MPPNTTAASTPSEAPAAFSTSAICRASSRVGATHAMMGFPGTTGCFEHICSPGAPKASVLPEPVEAMPIRSRLCRMIGQHWLWIGLGRSYWLNIHFSSLLGNCACMNSVTGFTSFVPPVSTVIPFCSRIARMSFVDIDATSACSLYVKSPPRDCLHRPALPPSALSFFLFLGTSSSSDSSTTSFCFFFFFFFSSLTGAGSSSASRSLRFFFFFSFFDSVGSSASSSCICCFFFSLFSFFLSFLSTLSVAIVVIRFVQNV